MVTKLHTTKEQQKNYSRDCPICGSTTAISGDIRRCDDPDCNWCVKKTGSWTTPRELRE